MTNLISFRNTNSVKAIFVLLFWQVVSDLLYILYLKPAAILSYFYGSSYILIISLEAAASVVYPIAGFLADAVYGRFKILKYSSFALVGFNTGNLFMLIIIPIMKLHPTALICARIMSCGAYFGRILFHANIIQFGMDQLINLPTQKSVDYIHINYWLHAMINLPITILRTSGVVIMYNPSDTSTVVILQAFFTVSVILLIVILFIVDKYKRLFLDEKLTHNPYKLVYDVIKYAAMHQKFKRRSAFTYCEDDPISRIDHGKTRYGGPFTTEQVEDVKVSFRIVLVLISLGLVFLLDLNLETLCEYYLRRHEYHHDISTVSVTTISSITPLIIIFGIPFFKFFITPYFSRYLPGMFKRIGLSIFVLIILYSTCFLIDIIAYKTIFQEDTECFGSNYSLDVNKELVYVPAYVMPIVVHILYGLYLMLINISVLEFISCQSPQHMKGILFGMFYCIISLFRLLSAVMSNYFFSNLTYGNVPKLNHS